VHELSLAEAILDTARRHAADRSVGRIDVRIGHLRQVVPDALAFAWEVLTSETEFAGCALVVEHVPAVVACTACGATTELDLPILQCGSCDGFAVTLISGEEFDFASLDVAERN
jgi:hydrogenase nickel incorporation protein HypA/HybF